MSGFEPLTVRLQVGADSSTGLTFPAFAWVCPPVAPSWPGPSAAVMVRRPGGRAVGHTAGRLDAGAHQAGPGNDQGLDSMEDSGMQPISMRSSIICPDYTGRRYQKLISPANCEYILRHQNRFGRCEARLDDLQEFSRRIFGRCFRRSRPNTAFIDNAL